MQMVAFPIAGSGGREVLINPEHVVCLMDLGEERTQIVTTGLSGAASMSLVVEVKIHEVARRLAVTSTLST